METPLILKNLDNGTITQDAAIGLMLKFTSHAYAIGALLDIRKQRDDYHDQLAAKQDETAKPTMQQHAVLDLIDHALDTGYIGPNRAHAYLTDVGMSTDTANHHIDTVTALRDRDFERVVYVDNPDLAPRYCTRCGRKVTAKELSRRAICGECSNAAMEENLIGLTTKTGPAYSRWRNAVLVWAYSLEDQEIAERPKPDAGTLGDYIETPIIGPWNSCPGNCASCNVANCPERDCDFCTPPNLQVTRADMIDHDKLPGCDGECYFCPDVDCAYRKDDYEGTDDELPF